MSTENSFIPENYEAPTGGGGFTKLKTGDNRLRILSSPLMMWIVWADKKVTRTQYKGQSNKPQKPDIDGASVKHGWGLVVWNYETDSIEVFELDKQAIIAALTTYGKDPDWGHPKNYDIVIQKSGSGMDTEYKFIAKPAKAPSDQIVEAFVANPIDLGQLLIEGGNPFLSNGGETASKQPEEQKSKVITPDNWTEGDPVPTGYKVADGKLKKDLPF
tara:strand:- start:22067 stop:22714 length:648 start_codon:yes stop_codon:yes gene_type:complete